ncbi:peptidoglycan-binding protein, partial [Streptomyces sp. NPDC005921]
SDHPAVTAAGGRGGVPDPAGSVVRHLDSDTSGPGPQWTEADRASYARWQRRLGYTGSSADGWPGAKSWAALKVPFVKEV